MVMGMDSGVEIMTETGVGALLKASRLRCGENLNDIAQQLRIRYSYLHALEEARVKELPGPTYAVGFVRAYAEHLGLDANEVVRRFKLENQKANGKSELVFPTPMPEGGVPSGAIVLVGVVIASLAYGGWYLSTIKEGMFEEYISPLPDRLMALVPSGLLTDSQTSGDKPSRIDMASEATSRPEPSPSSATAAVPTAPVLPPAASEIPAASPVPAVPPVAVPHIDTRVQSATAGAPATVPAPAAPRTELAAVVPSVPKAKEPSPAAAPVPPAVPVAPVTSVAVPPLPVPDAPLEVAAITPEAGSAARVWGTENQDSRILLRARSDSWIQVRDSEKRLVMTRLLKSGDSYQVPDQPGLTLVTGNAGALEVLVDGAAVPPIGAMGAVRKNVALDVEKLMQGTAASN